MIVRILLIRHGQTQGNLKRRYIGLRTDEEILKSGEERAVQTGRRLSLIMPGDFTVYCSPMRRCVRTAQLMFAGKEPVVCPGLAEMDFGLFEGKNHDELLADPKLCRSYQAWLDSGCALPVPEGESRAAFEDRNYAEFKRVIGLECERTGCQADPIQSPDESFAAIICHGGTIMSIMSRLGCGNYYDFMTANLDGYDLELEARDEEIHAVSFHRLYERIYS